MPAALKCVREQGSNRAVVLIQYQSIPEPADAMELLRMLKVGFPDEWRTVHYEIVAANGQAAAQRFQLPGSIEPG